MSEHAASPSIPLLLIVYVALMILLILTVAGAHITVGVLALVVGLAIAAAKAILVILFYMHVRYSSRVTWIFAAAGFLWLGIFFTLTFSDYLTRSWTPRAQDIAAHPSAVPAPPGVHPVQIDPALHQAYQASPYEHPH